MVTKNSGAGNGLTGHKRGYAIALGLAGVLPVLALAVPANAAVTATLGSTANVPANWPSTPNIGTATPSATTITNAGTYALEQTITVGSSPLTLSRIDFASPVSSNFSANMTLSIYKVSDPLTAGFAPSLTNLLPGGGAFSYSATSAAKAILTLDLTDTDQITLAANTSYAISLKKVSASSNPGFYYFTATGNSNSAYTGGALFYHEQFVTNDGSDAAFAIYAAPIPEPASLGLLAIGALGLLARRRRG